MPTQPTIFRRKVNSLNEGNEFILTFTFAIVFGIMNLCTIGFIYYIIFKNTYDSEINLAFRIFAIIPLSAIIFAFLIAYAATTPGFSFRVRWNPYYGLFLSFRMAYSIIFIALAAVCFGYVITRTPFSRTVIYLIFGIVSSFNLIFCNAMMICMGVIFSKNYGFHN